MDEGKDRSVQFTTTFWVLQYDAAACSTEGLGPLYGLTMNVKGAPVNAELLVTTLSCWASMRVLWAVWLMVSE